MLEQGECDAGDVAMYVVGKVLADETAMPNRLYSALLAEFRSRHRLCDCLRQVRRRSNNIGMVAVFPQMGSSRRGADYKGFNSASSASQADGTSSFSSLPGLEKSFSFVEETEIVEEEEESDAAFGGAEDGYSSSSSCRGGGGVCEEETPPNTPAAGGTYTMEMSPRSAVVMAGSRRAAATAPSKDTWRGRHSRADSWVELEGTECSNCGGKMASRNTQGRSASTLGRDVEEDEGGLGEGWAAAEAPPCWCSDEEGLSTNLEVPRSTAHSLPRDAGRCKNGNASATGMDGRQTEIAIAKGVIKNEDESDLVPTLGGEPIPENELETPAVQLPATNTDQTKRFEEGGTETGGGDGITDGIADGNKGRDEEACDALRDVHGVLRELTRAVLAWCPLLTASDEAAIQAVNCIDQRVFSKTYGPVYGCIASGQALKRDAELLQLAQRDEQARTTEGRPKLATMCRPQVLAALSAAGAARTGRDKLRFLVEAVEKVSEALPPTATTDTLLWSLCRHLAAATVVTAGVDIEGTKGKGDGVPLRRPHAEVAFVEQFMRDESWLMGKQGYVLTTVDAALHVLLTPAMSGDIFVDPPVAAEDGGSGRLPS